MVVVKPNMKTTLRGRTKGVQRILSRGLGLIHVWVYFVLPTKKSVLHSHSTAECEAYLRMSPGKE